MTITRPACAARRPVAFSGVALPTRPRRASRPAAPTATAPGFAWLDRPLPPSTPLTPRPRWRLPRGVGPGARQSACCVSTGKGRHNGPALSSRDGSTVRVAVVRAMASSMGLSATPEPHNHPRAEHRPAAFSGAALLARPRRASQPAQGRPVPVSPGSIILRSRPHHVGGCRARRWGHGRRRPPFAQCVGEGVTRSGPGGGVGGEGAFAAGAVIGGGADYGGRALLGRWGRGLTGFADGFVASAGPGWVSVWEEDEPRLWRLLWVGVRAGGVGWVGVWRRAVVWTGFCGWDFGVAGGGTMVGVLRPVVGWAVRAGRAGVRR